MVQSRCLQVFRFGLFQHLRRFVFLIRCQVGDRRVAVFVVDTGFQGDFMAAETAFHFHHIAFADVQLPGNLFYFLWFERFQTLFQAAQVEKQLALCLGGGDLHQTPVAQDVFVHFGTDPMQRERHQAHAALRIVAFYRLHQADVALLDQIGLWQAITGIAAGNAHHHAQVGHHQLARGIQIVLLAKPGGQLHFLLLRQQGDAVNLLNITFQAACRRKHG